MKKSIRYIFLIIIIAILLVTAWNKSGTPVLNLITEDETTEKVNYITVKSNKRKNKRKVFESDDFTIYTADKNSFTSHISGSKVVNELNEVTIRNIEGNKIEANEDITNLFKAVSEIDHDIWRLDVIEYDNRLFALVYLNVNWQSPNDFYEYNKETKTLEKLTRLQNEFIIGIAKP